MHRIKMKRLVLLSDPHTGTYSLVQFLSSFFGGTMATFPEFSVQVDEDEKIRIIGKVKKGASDFRKNFLATLQHLAPVLHKSIQDNIDKLTDDLTNAISNDELKLCNEKTYE